MKIHVTQAHIDQASTLRYSKRLSECCPIALALIGAGYELVEVYDCARGVFNGVHVNQPLTEEMHEFVIDFDNHRQVKPFEFDGPRNAVGMQAGIWEEAGGDTL